MTDLSDLADDRKLHRVYLTVQAELTVDTRTTDGTKAWDIIASPENRRAIARRLQEAKLDDLAMVISLSGFVEELTDETAQSMPVGTLYSTDAEPRGRVIVPGREAGPLT